MPSYLNFYDATDTTLQTAALMSGPVNGGTTWSVPLILWNDKGGSHGDATTAKGITVSATISNGATEFASGYPPLDNKWVGVQVTAFNPAGDSTMQPQTGIGRIGAGQVFAITDIPKNCSRSVTISFSPPPGCSNAPYAAFLHVAVDEDSLVLPLKLGTVSGSGILPEWMDSSARRLTRGRTLSATGTADVGVANGSYAWDGTANTKPKTTVTLNQTDGASASLTSGNAYKARLSQQLGGTVTVTKGAQAATPAKPNVPTGEINLGTATVRYQAGGSSAIVSADLDVSDVTYGEFLLTAGSGLNAIIGAGTAISSADSEPILSSSILVPLTDNSTNYVWLGMDGSGTATTTTATPSTGAQLIGTAATSGGAVVSVSDLRTFVGHAIYDYAIKLRKSGAITTTATDIEWEPAPADSVIMKVTSELGTPGTAASGSTIVDIKTRLPGADMSTSATTIYTSSGSDDQRPAIAWNATSLRAESYAHEVTTVAAGTRISADIAAVPAGITVNPTDLFVYVYLRRLR